MRVAGDAIQDKIGVRSFKEIAVFANEFRIMIGFRSQYDLPRTNEVNLNLIFIHILRRCP